MSIVAVTGHRPDKLGGYDQNAMDWLVAVAYKSLRLLKPDAVITGMALGWDTAVAEAAVGLRIPFIAAVPFKGQERLWPEPSQDRYRALLDQAQTVVYVSPPGYAPFKMQARNRWMVDKADTVLALWDGSNGGTGNAVRYALRQQKPLVNAWPIFQRIDDLLEPINGVSDGWQEPKSG